MLPTAELLISDPPYGMDYQCCHRVDWQRKPKIQGDDEFPGWLLDYEAGVAKMLCCRWDNLPKMPVPRSFIVWDKGRHGMGDLSHEFGRQWEAIAFYPGKDHSFTNRPVDVIRIGCIPPKDLVHPNEKPAAIFIPLIRSHRGSVLDPYCGTGSVLQAAKELGRTAIGIEIEERYCEIAAERLRQRVLF